MSRRYYLCLGTESSRAILRCKYHAGKHWPLRLRRGDRAVEGVAYGGSVGIVDIQSGSPADGIGSEWNPGVQIGRSLEDKTAGWTNLTEVESVGVADRCRQDGERHAFANRIVAKIGDEESALLIDGDAVWAVKTSGGAEAICGAEKRRIPSECGNHPAGAAWRKFADGFVKSIGNKNVAESVDGYPARVIKLRGRAVAIHPPGNANGPRNR